MLQLVFDLYRQVDRYSEGQALIAAGVGEYLRIDADHFSLHVEQGTAGIARVDRDVGLNEGDVGSVRQRARFCADDPRSHRILESKRGADRQDPLAHLLVAAVAELDRGQAGRVDLEYRDIAGLVAADDFGAEFASVGELHRHLGCTVDDMGIGEDDAVRTHDEAGSFAVLRRRAVRHGTGKLAEELKERAVRIDSFKLRRVRPGLGCMRHADVDYSRTVALHDPGKVGEQGARRRRGRNGQRGGGSASLLRKPVPGGERARAHGRYHGCCDQAPA